jgi:hypothetical protein
MICLFAAGYQPPRGEACGCTAESNCGCACWRHGASVPAAGHEENSPARPCCAPKETRKSSVCGASRDSSGRTIPALPETKSGPHDTGQPMDWLVSVAPRVVTLDESDQVPECRRITVSNVSLEPQVPPP